MALMVPSYPVPDDFLSMVLLVADTQDLLRNEQLYQVSPEGKEARIGMSGVGEADSRHCVHGCGILVENSSLGVWRGQA
jgi:hypothetical protein